MIRTTPVDPVAPPEGYSGEGDSGAPASPHPAPDSPAAVGGRGLGPWTRCRWAVALTATMWAGGASAGDRWQGTAWDGYGREHESWRATPWRPGPIYQTLDAVAGGIEKLFRLDRRSAPHGARRAGGDSACDDGCDAATLLLIESGRGSSRPLAPGDDRDRPGRLVPDVRQAPAAGGAAPSVRPSPPRTRPLPPPPGQPAVPQQRQRQEPDGGSIFDALGDPFEDDAASRVPRGRGSIATRPRAHSIR